MSQCWPALKGAHAAQQCLQDQGTFLIILQDNQDDAPPTGKDRILNAGASCCSPAKPATAAAGPAAGASAAEATAGRALSLGSWCAAAVRGTSCSPLPSLPSDSACRPLLRTLRSCRSCCCGGLHWLNGERGPVSGRPPSPPPSSCSTAFPTPPSAASRLWRVWGERVSPPKSSARGEPLGEEWALSGVPPSLSSLSSP